MSIAVPKVLPSVYDKAGAQNGINGLSRQQREKRKNLQGEDDLGSRDEPPIDKVNDGRSIFLQLGLGYKRVA